MADWDAVAEAISSRMRELRLTQMEVASKSGVSIATIRELQHNTAPRRRNRRTLAAISSALRWPDDHLERVGAGVAEDAETTAPPSGEFREVMGNLDEIQRQVQSLGDRLAHLEELVLPADQRSRPDAHRGE